MQSNNKNLPEPIYSNDMDMVIEKIITHTQGNIVLAIPLGLGKPNQLVNALYQHIKKHPEYSLKIITALSLTKPTLNSGLEKRLVAPILERLFADYVELDYIVDIKNKSVPSNIHVGEFFFQTATLLNSQYAQQNYISSNYTHVARDLVALKVNVLAQMISEREHNGQIQYSFSCNPEVTLDLIKIIGEDPEYPMPLRIAQVHRQLPFMVNDAQVDASGFDIIIDNPKFETRLFSTPNPSVSLTDHAIGFHASTLVKDNGTLQIGIGSLGDAIANNLIIRQNDNNLYQNLLQHQNYSQSTIDLISTHGGTREFDDGLYGCSEMFVPGFLELKKQKILKRFVYNDKHLQQLINQKIITPELEKNSFEVLYQNNYLGEELSQHTFNKCMHFGILNSICKLSIGQDPKNNKLICPNGNSFSCDLSDPDARKKISDHCLGDHLKNGVLVHGGFFLGHQKFYQELRDLDVEERDSIFMTGISFINDIHWQTELKCEQRQHARYLNTAFLATLLGSSTADALEDGRVLSGVGGQYNFVAQAQEIPNGRSILMLRSTRSSAGNVTSNIVWNYGHTTIPRHLRDIYISEYGIADTRGKCDSDVIKEMLNISDSRFQNELLEQAKEAGKIEKNYSIPENFQNNTPQQLKLKFEAAVKSEKFSDYPFGGELNEQELELADALGWLKDNTASTKQKLVTVGKALLHSDSNASKKPRSELLERMQLNNPQGFKEKLMQKLVIFGLSETS